MSTLKELPFRTRRAIGQIIKQKWIWALPCAAVLVGTSLTATWAQSVQRIAAIVNDEVISGYDLQQRMSLVLSSSGLQPSPEALKRLEPQVLRTLVDERLQLQEAERNEIEVETREIAEAIADIGARNNLSPEQIESFLGQAGIDFATLQRQVYAELAWNKLIGQRFGARVFISDEQVDSAYNRFLENSSQPQYRMAEIFLSVDSPEQDEEVRRTGQRLVQEIIAGAPFDAIAQQFSQASTAGVGGDVGWVQEGQLAPELDTQLLKMSPGSVSAPIRTIGGYYILAMLDRRETAGGADAMRSTVTLKQILIPLSPEAPREEISRAANKASRARSAVRGCGNVEQVATQYPGAVPGDIGKVPGSQLTENFRGAVMSLRKGEASAPVRSANGFHVLVVCDKEEQLVQLPSRGDIQTRLFNQRIGMMSRRYLRDLRRDAVVEVR